MQTTSALAAWIIHYGHWALFVLLAIGIVGLPIPDETLMVFAGVLIAKGALSLSATYISALLGSMCGITLSYFLGKTLGYFLVEKYGKYFKITHAKLERAHHWFERIGKWALFFGYFIPGVRHLTGYVAGTARLSWHYFALFAYLGAFFWVSTFLSIGYFFGDRWQIIIDNVDRDIYYGVMISSLVLIILYLLYRSGKK